MQTSFNWKWPAITAAGLLTAAGALVVCKVTPGCHGNAEPRTEAPPVTSTLGDEKMTVTHTERQVHHANETNFNTLVLKSDVPVLVDFYADWCGPCQRLAPVLEALAAEMPGVRIVKVNVDHSPALAAEYGVDAIPSLKVFKNGKITDQLAGLASKDHLRALLTQ